MSKGKLSRKFGKLRVGIVLSSLIVLGVTGILLGFGADGEDIDPTSDLAILYLEPTAIKRGQKFQIFGDNFGDLPGDGEVRIGKQKHYEDPALGKGKHLHRVRLWSPTKIKVVLSKDVVPEHWEGSKKYVWVEKEGKKSNYKKVQILPGADEYNGTWYVDAGAAPLGNGMSWSEAFQTIREAVDAAQTEDEIWVKQGDYLIR